MGKIASGLVLKTRSGLSVCVRQGTMDAEISKNMQIEVFEFMSQSAISIGRVRFDWLKHYH
ncbi:MAG: hypothetical protein ABSA58_16185 [Acetobacteraceae bacterium]|jgi:hypothetical protein